jgi:hypothetical protein
MMKFALLVTAFVAPAFLVSAQTANISRTDLAITGKSLSSGLQNASGVTYFPNDGKTLLAFKNNSGSAVTGTVITQKASVSKEGYSPVTLANATISIASGSTVIAGPYPTSQWNTTKGTVGVSMSSVTGISATAVRVQ